MRQKVFLNVISLNFIFFKIRFFLVETIGGVCILRNMHEVRLCFFLWSHKKKRTCIAKFAGKKIKKWFLLTTWPTNSLFFSTDQTRPGLQRRNFLKYQFHQENSLLITKKLLLKNKKFCCVEGLSGFFWIFVETKVGNTYIPVGEDCFYYCS